MNETRVVKDPGCRPLVIDGDTMQWVADDQKKLTAMYERQLEIDARNARNLERYLRARIDGACSRRG